jgi:RimJ/RimL family protein N-acetyltransferase
MNEVRLLETDRLTLRSFTTDDVELLVELDSDPEVMRFLNGGTPTPRAFIEREILPRFTSYDGPRGAFGFWAAFQASTHEFVGWFSLRSTGHGEASIGYRLRRSAWGKGYATEGARGLIRLAFDELGIRRIVAGAYEHNVASRRVMEKAGLSLVRRYRVTEDELAASDTFDPSTQGVWDGYDVDYAIDAQTWRAQDA